MPRATTAEFRTKIHLKGAGRTVAGRRYRGIHQFSLQKYQERNIVFRSQAGNILWGQVRMEPIGHITLRGFQATINWSPNSPYQSCHVALNSFIIDVLKMVPESSQNARLNSDGDEAEDADGADTAWGAERAVDRPKRILSRGETGTNNIH